MAAAHARLGQINRLLERPDDAAREYREAIAQFTSLDRERTSAEYRQALANAYNGLGETFRRLPDRAADAASAYDAALQLQSALAQSGGGDAMVRQELARTHYNRGIVRSLAAQPGDPAFVAAESDFRAAIQLLEPLSRERDRRPAAQELARVYNNLASLIAADTARLLEARELYDRAIGIDERLVTEEPGNREYKLELAQYRDNAADLLQGERRYDAARERNRQALGLLTDLAKPAPSLGIELADAHNLRARILAAEGSPDAVAAYEESVAQFEALANDPAARRLAQFHLRYGDLLLNLAALSHERPDARAHQVLTRAVTRYLALADASAPPAAQIEAQTILDNVEALLADLSPEDRRSVEGPYGRLRDRLATRK
jgi:tetratricopeptide (TPR) repeat protein